MYKNNTIAVVIRVHNEEKFIAGVVNSVPNFVDKIYIINDASTDGTFSIISSLSQKDFRVVIINHQIKGGAGSAAISGLKKSQEEKIDITAIVDGDGQMNLNIFTHFLDPIVSGNADCTKGDRLSQRENRKEMPFLRAFGNSVLTYLTRLSSGYWHISDPQNGYMAISKETLSKINLDRIVRGFAFENDLLVKLNVIDARVINIPHAAIYRGQHSKIVYSSFIVNTSWILLKDLVWRIYMKSLHISSI
jgi:glycosyltransferase involved in cell wall biosynthesis